MMNRFMGILSLMCLLGCNEDHANKNTFAVQATVETDPGPLKGNVIDTPALWVNRVRPDDSIVIAGDRSKEGLGGLRLYSLDGHQVAFVQAGGMNNVGVRYDFPLKDQKVDLIVASDFSHNTLAIYKMGANGRSLEDITGRLVRPDQPIYGMCLFQHKGDNEYYAFITSLQGRVQQWRLRGNQTGTVDAHLVRSFEVGSKIEGCVVDDEQNQLFIAADKKGILRYNAQEDSNANRTVVDEVGDRLGAGVDGVTLVYFTGKEGYLIASSHENSSFSIYKRQGQNRYVGTFRITEGAVGPALQSRGIDVTSVPLGAKFPQGVFVAHNDGFGTGKGSNLKLVPWEAIAVKLDVTKK